MATLEVVGHRGLIELEGARYRIGRRSDNDLVLDSDTAVSREHALLESIGSRWFITDLDSSNGTEVNGTRLMSGVQRSLSCDDEILIGRTRLLFRDRNTAPDVSTSKRAPRPKLTPKEKQVLKELGRPLLLSHGPFPRPATVKEIAERMYVGEAAVKAHLARLYDKFEVYEQGADRRRELANRAIESGSVTRRDLEEGDDTDA